MISKDHLSPSRSRAELMGQSERRRGSSALDMLPEPIQDRALGLVELAPDHRHHHAYEGPRPERAACPHARLLRALRLQAETALPVRHHPGEAAAVLLDSPRDLASLVIGSTPLASRSRLLPNQDTALADGVRRVLPVDARGERMPRDVFARILDRLPHLPDRCLDDHLVCDVFHPWLSLQLARASA